MTAQQHPGIAELIRLRQDETGWSLNAIATATGGRVSRQTMSNLAAGRATEWPKSTDTVTGLATALGVREETIVLAYATTIGIPISKTPSLLAAQLPANTDLLTPAERNHILGLIRALTDGRTPDQGDGDG
ncbi:hypothetical protein [Gordonia sp. SND2]|uniref:hypothetical protein n=1 Tax=Gordonia sp. SND2 TaxID=3388659 RepID=UPI00398B7B5E